MNCQNNTDLLYTEKLLMDAIIECRGISHDLLPAMLQEHGLEEAIKEICLQLKGDVRFQAHLKGLKPRLPLFLEVAIYRILQELLMNIIKHANATDATIRVVTDKKSIEISVKDNGKGVSQEGPKKKGIGLSTIRYKTQLLNGTFEMTSNPGKGTATFIRLPIRVN